MSTEPNRIIFLSVPESLRGRIESLTHDGHDHGVYDDDDEQAHSGQEFTIDPAIPIPVELHPGETTLDFDRLSWEMILAGMLRVISGYPPDSTASTNAVPPIPDLTPETINYYRRFVLTVKPGIMGEFTEAAILHARNGAFESALEILTALRGLFPQSPEVLLNRALVLENRADALERAGREAEAEAENGRAGVAYRELITLNPPFPNGLFNAGFFYIKRHAFDQARECFTAYISLAEDPEKKERAEAMVREITTRSLDDEIFQEAYDCIRLGDEEQGLLKIREFLEHHPNVWNGWFILGWALRKQRRWDDGAAAFRQAIEMGGGNSDTRNELAICLMEQGDYPAARKELELALREDPENVKIISNLGVLALKKGEDDEAAAFFRTVLELEPEDPIAKKFFGGTLSED
ncbi:hypothetical protein AGMMS49991_00570 [Spirochaetia bacterium]|nr:hypothetical protein AGMMS49991_00570 [Spirochaetia bacterium]